jgi:hypothetical protein
MAVNWSGATEEPKTGDAALLRRGYTGDDRRSPGSKRRPAVGPGGKVRRPCHNIVG